MRRWLMACLAIAAFATPAAAQQPVIAAIQVQGNTLTPDAEVIQASGLTSGAPFSDDLLASTTARLAATKRFQHVEVSKRYASIADATQITVLIQVDEGPVRIVSGPLPGQAPRVARRGSLSFMYSPLLDWEDGYGLAYGLYAAVTGASGRGGRVILPLSWGGDKRAGAEFEREFAARLAPRLRTGVLAQRRTNPFYEREAVRTRAWLRGEWRLPHSLIFGATTAWQKVTLLDRTDRARSLGADIVLDTRLDPVLPRNAMYARAAIDRLHFSDGPLVQTQLEADGYLSVYRGSVLVLRAARAAANRAVPPFFKSILGGADTLRGFEAGTALGDTMVTTSAEMLVPLTSPLRVARFGASAFLDMGTAYDHGQRLADQQLKKGAGGGLWMAAPFFRARLMVAHGVGSGNRVHFDAGLTF